MRIALVSALAMFLTVGCDGNNGSAIVTPPGDATYQVTFTATWSAATHPTDFPPGPHFSGLIGATHNAGTSLWQVGQTASAGIENMAENGAKSPLTSEIDAAIQGGTARFTISGGGVGSSPGVVTVTFGVTEGHSRVTLVSMLAPSPDWFVGVDGLDLMDNGQWVQTRTVTLMVYDAGTDDGASFTSANAESNPHQPIQLITMPPFASAVPVGTFTFVRMS